MKIFNNNRSKTQLLLAVVLILTGISAFLPRSYLLQQFKSFQRVEIERNIAMVHYAMQAEETSLNNTCLDWAHWDDMYQYVQDHNQQFVDANLHMDYLKESSKIDLFSLYDQNDHLLWGNIYLSANPDGKRQNLTSLQEEMNLLAQRHYVRQVSGFILTDHGLMIISIAPMLPSSGEGAARGILIMGRFLKEGWLQDITRHIQLPLELPDGKYYLYNSVEKDILRNLENAAYIIDSADSGSPVVRMTMQDFYGENFLVSFKLPQTIMGHGAKAANFVSLAFFAALLLFIASFLGSFSFYNNEVKKRRRELAEQLDLRSRELAESEERYRQIFDDAEDSIFTVDLNFTLLDANRSAYERLGYSREEAIGQNISLFLPPGSMGDIIRWRAQILEKKKLRIEAQQVKKDGSLLEVEITSQLLEHQGRISILNIARDITRRKQAEKAFLTSERRYKTIFENSPLGIAYINSNGLVLSANQQLLIIAGLSMESLIGANTNDLFAGHKFADIFSEAIRGISTSYESRYINPLSGNSQILKILFSPVVIGGPTYDVICLIEDITEQRRDEENLRQLYTAIEQSPIVVIITDRHGIIQFANQSYSRTTGYQLQEITGRYPDIIKSPYQSPEYIKNIWDIIRSGQIWQGELQFSKKSGVLFWGKVAVSPVRDANGCISNYVGIMEDISEKKLMEQAEAAIKTLEREGGNWSTRQIDRHCLKEAMRLSDSVVGFLAFSLGNDHNYALRIITGEAEYEYQMDPALFHQMQHNDIWNESMESGMPILDNQAADRVSPIPENHVKINRVMSIPIIHDGEVVGLIGLANKKEDYSQTDLKMAELFTRNCWSTVRRQKAEKSLRESEERIRKIFNSVQAGIILIDAQSRRIIDANPSALSMFGASISELLGKYCYETICPTGQTRCPVLDLGARVDNSEQMLVRFDGSQLPILKSVTRISFGNQIFLLESFLDLSERKTIEAELYEAKEAAEAASRSKSTFLANMSHEIRTPMNAILGYAQLLKHEPGLSSRQLRSLEIINRSGNHLLKLIDDILEMSKIEAGRAVLHESNCDFTVLLQDIENMFRLRADEKGLQLQVERINELPRYILVDEGKVRQILVNLLGNAMKFTDEGGISIRLEQVESPETKEALENLSRVHELITITIEVEDSGCGISEAGDESIFGAFVQAEEGRAQGTGTGLGLSISRDFARLLGGDLTLVRSEPGAGSLFRFSFTCRVIDVDHYTIKCPDHKAESIYDINVQAAEPDTKALETPATVMTMNSLPGSMITSLLEAVKEGDMQRLNSLIAELTAIDQITASYLQTLADNYDYTAIIKLLDRRKH